MNGNLSTPRCPVSHFTGSSTTAAAFLFGGGAAAAAGSRTHLVGRQGQGPHALLQIQGGRHDVKRPRRQLVLLIRQHDARVAVHRNGRKRRAVDRLRLEVPLRQLSHDVGVELVRSHLLGQQQIGLAHLGPSRRVGVIGGVRQQFGGVPPRLLQQAGHGLRRHVRAREAPRSGQRAFDEGHLFGKNVAAATAGAADHGGASFAGPNHVFDAVPERIGTPLRRRGALLLQIFFGRAAVGEDAFDGNRVLSDGLFPLRGGLLGFGFGAGSCRLFRGGFLPFGGGGGGGGCCRSGGRRG